MPLPPRRLIMHVGMHKTGTKALQSYLLENRLQLAEGGVHYPTAGLVHLGGDQYTPGHHQIPFDFFSEGGSASFAAVLQQMRLVQAATVVLSSEEFLPLMDLPGAVETIVASARELGYEPAAVVYLRAQPDSLESTYSELAKGSRAANIEDLIDQALRDGRFKSPNHDRTFELTYSRIVERLEAIFGSGNVIARAYHPERGSDYGHTDFLEVVARARGGLRLENLQNTRPRANERVTLRRLFANIAQLKEVAFDPESFVRERFPQVDPAELERPFSLITRYDRERFLARFAGDNAALNARFDTDIPFVSVADIVMSDADEARAQEHRALLAAVLLATA
jgi:hypothetical protein